MFEVYNSGDYLYRKIIIIEGYPASGKSTFAQMLSAKINIPCFIKDTFKTALCKDMSIDKRETSSLLSGITFNAIMYATERLFTTGNPIIIEGNFVPANVKKIDESHVIKNFIDQYAYTPLTFKFSGDTQVLYERFIKREKSPERGQANTIFGGLSFDEFDRYCRNLDAFSVGGQIIKIDTTDFKTIDFENHIKTVDLFINSESNIQPFIIM